MKIMSSKKVCVGICNEDRISSLPDCVISHILSFLPTKYSLRTSVLSIRWNHLFTLVPNLDFEFNILTNPDSLDTTPASFVQFVNSVFISYHVSRMNKFHFSFSYPGGDIPHHFPIVSWISSVVRRHVREIHISTCLNSPCTLPRSIFSCKTLVTLSLHGEFTVALPHTVCLPCLRDCGLICVKFDNESARKLFRSCPVLENLDLKECELGEGVEFLDISSPTIKNLIIWGGDRFQIMLDLPNLICFRYVGAVSNEFLGMESLKSMVDASVYYEPDMYTIDGLVEELVRSYCQVQRLGLNCDVMEAFITSGHLLPKFNNLTSLTLPIAPISSAASRLLPDLLDNSPRLEFLEICKGCGDNHNGDGENSYFLPEHVPSCVSLHLKEVKKIFTGLDYERELIKYFLKSANNLKTMTIQSKLSCSEQFEISSVGCQVVFYTVDVE